MRPGWRAETNSSGRVKASVDAPEIEHLAMRNASTCASVHGIQQLPHSGLHRPPTRPQVDVGRLQIVFVRLGFVAGDGGKLFRREWTRIHEQIWFERAGAAGRLDLQQQLDLRLTLCDVQDRAGYRDMVLMIDAVCLTIMGHDDCRNVFADPLLDLHDQAAAVLQVAIGQRAAEQVEAHDRAGVLGLLNAAIDRAVRRSGGAVGDDRDKNPITARLQHSQASKTGQFGIVGMCEHGKNGLQIKTPTHRTNNASIRPDEI